MGQRPSSEQGSQDVVAYDGTEGTINVHRWRNLEDTLLVMVDENGDEAVGVWLSPTEVNGLVDVLTANPYIGPTTREGMD